MRIKLAVVFGMLLIGSACAAPAPPSTTTTTAPPVDDPALNVVLAAGGGTIFAGQEQTFTIASPIDASQIQRFGLTMQLLAPCAGENFGNVIAGTARVYGLIETVVDGVPRTIRVNLFSFDTRYPVTTYWSQPVPPTLELVVSGGGGGTRPSCDFEVALWGARG